MWRFSKSNSISVTVPEKKEETSINNSPLPLMAVNFSENEEILALAEKAKAVLGYNLLEARIASPVLRALVKLEIIPLEENKVREYRKLAEKESSYYWTLIPLDFYTAKHVLDGSNEMFQGEKLSLRQYSKEIPEFVLQKAIQIREALPECGLYVEELQFYPDPFLVVVQGSERYTVEVWDEPKFEGRISK